MSEGQDKYSVLFVCLGNICRSPLAEGVFRMLAEERSIASRLEIDSCGTGGWHVGEPPHLGSQRVAKVHGIDISGLRARSISKEDFKRFDLLVAMDSENERYLKNHSSKESGRICLLREYDPERDSADVPDPYFQGNFEEVYDIIERSCRKLLDEVARRVAGQPSEQE